MNKKIIKPIVLVVIIIVIGFTVRSYLLLKENQALEKGREELLAICMEYNISDVVISKPTAHINCEWYVMRVDGTNLALKLEDIYSFVQQTERVRLENTEAILVTEVTLNGKSYSIDYRDEVLKCDREIVFQFFSEEEKKKLELLKDRLPYEGMPEKFINYTVLGEPDEIEYSLDYYSKVERARHITYTWYDDEGMPIAVALVTHWDYANRRVVDGYIFSLNLF